MGGKALALPLGIKTCFLNLSRSILKERELENHEVALYGRSGQAGSLMERQDGQKEQDMSGGYGGMEEFIVRRTQPPTASRLNSRAVPPFLSSLSCRVIVTASICHVPVSVRILRTI